MEKLRTNKGGAAKSDTPSIKLVKSYKNYKIWTNFSKSNIPGPFFIDSINQGLTFLDPNDTHRIMFEVK